MGLAQDHLPRGPAEGVEIGVLGFQLVLQLSDAAVDLGPVCLRSLQVLGLLEKMDLQRSIVEAAHRAVAHDHVGVDQVLGHLGLVQGPGGSTGVFQDAAEAGGVVEAGRRDRLLLQMLDDVDAGAGQGLAVGDREILSENSLAVGRLPEGVEDLLPLRVVRDRFQAGARPRLAALRRYRVAGLAHPLIPAGEGRAIVGAALIGAVVPEGSVGAEDLVEHPPAFGKVAQARHQLGVLKFGGDVDGALQGEPAVRTDWRDHVDQHLGQRPPAPGLVDLRQRLVALGGDHHVEVPHQIETAAAAGQVVDGRRGQERARRQRRLRRGAEDGVIHVGADLRSDPSGSDIADRRQPSGMAPGRGALGEGGQGLGATGHHRLFHQHGGPAHLRLDVRDLGSGKAEPRGRGRVRARPIEARLQLAHHPDGALGRVPRLDVKDVKEDPPRIGAVPVDEQPRHLAEGGIRGHDLVHRTGGRCAHGRDEETGGQQRDDKPDHRAPSGAPSQKIKLGVKITLGVDRPADTKHDTPPLPFAAQRVIASFRPASTTGPVPRPHGHRHGRGFVGPGHRSMRNNH